MENLGVGKESATDAPNDEILVSEAIRDSPLEDKPNGDDFDDEKA